MNVYFKENQKARLARKAKKDLEVQVIDQMKRNTPMRSQNLEKYLKNQNYFKEEMNKRSQRASRLSMSVNQLSSQRQSIMDMIDNQSSRHQSRMSQRVQRLSEVSRAMSHGK